MGRYEEAVIDYTRAIDLDPGFWLAFNHRGLALWALGEREAALRDYERMKGLTRPG